MEPRMTKSPERRPRDANDRIQGVRVTEEKTSLVLDLWRGDVPLVKTYWLFGVVVGICFAITFAFIEYQSEGLSEGFGPLFIIGLIVLYFVYVAFINVAIWRSSNKYKGPKRWAILAKVMVIVSWSALIREAWEIYSVV
ncbi:MAG: hypothetical protein AMJ67_13705 [Betaproteobacteria bacterium SG8_41]|nr:MAG: hypothetical protein AMJ67_13705 [Betaproteobacteria bacterium SG8_41]